MNDTIQIEKDGYVPVFQTNGVIKNDELETLKESIKRQIKDGIIIIDGKLNFLGCFRHSDSGNLCFTPINNA